MWYNMSQPAVPTNGPAQTVSSSVLALLLTFWAARAGFDVPYWISGLPGFFAQKIKFKLFWNYEAALEGHKAQLSSKRVAQTKILADRHSCFVAVATVNGTKCFGIKLLSRGVLSSLQSTEPTCWTQVLRLQMHRTCFTLGKNTACPFVKKVI